MLGNDGLSKKEKLQFEVTIYKANVLVTKNAEKPAKKLGVREVEQKEKYEPIRYWAAHLKWPKNFREYSSMASSNTNNKRQRTLDRSWNDKDERTRSYFQSRRDGNVPNQFTAAYKRHILTKGLNMDLLKGKELVAEESKKLCADLQQITQETIGPTVFPAEAIRKVLN